MEPYIRKYLAKLLAKPISAEFEITVRTYNALATANIKTFGDLVTKEEKALLEDNNFAPSSVDEIKEQLARFGLTLGMRLDDMDVDVVWTLMTKMYRRNYSIKEDPRLLRLLRLTGVNNKFHEF